MDDEFALCWNNFQENIATGFQNLYDRGDLVDVTLACDGKLLHAHKIVLAICSPYFQEMFHTNPCKHPIIVLKDVAFGVMCELLQFMYQGVVNVKHTELQSFMKIAQMLQVKGLATSPSSTQKSPSLNQSNANNATAANLTVAGSSSTGNNQSKNNTNNSNTNTNNSQNDISNSNVNDAKINVTAPPASSSASSSSSISFSHIKSPNEGNNNTSSALMTGPGLKRLSEYSTDTLSIYSRKVRRNTDNSDHDINSDSMDHMSEDVFLPPIPHISMMEQPRFDLNNVKRESSDHLTSPSSLRNSLPPPFGFDYNIYAANKNIEYPNDLHMPSDYSKSFANHMDIPPIAPGERWFHGKLEFMLSQRGKPLLVHDGHTFGIQYVRKDKKYWQCNLSRKFNCKARVTTTDTGEIIVTNNEHCHTEIRQHLRKDYQRNKVMMNALMNLSTSHHIEQQLRRNSNNNCYNNSNVKDDLNSHCHNSNTGGDDDNDNEKCSTSSSGNNNNHNNNNNNWKNNRNSTT